MTATVTDFAARQADLHWLRERHRRERPEEPSRLYHLPPPVVIRGLQARVKAAPVSRKVYAKAARVAGLVHAYGASTAYALLVGASELRA